MYSKMVCSGENEVITYEGYGVDDFCHRLDDIMKEHNSTDYWDPHNCRESCSDPGYACVACTNPDYFTCTRNNTEVCIHPELVCNKYPDCDNGVDEDPEA